MRHRYSVLFFPLHVIIDFISLNVGFVGGYWIKFGNIEPVSRFPYESLWIAFNLVWLVEIVVFKPYIFPRQLFKLDHLLKKLVLLVGIHMAVIAIFWVAVKGFYYSREHLLITYVLFITLASLFRLGGLLFLREYRTRGYNNRRYAIAGYGKLATTIRGFYDAHPEMGFHFCGYFDEPTAENQAHLTASYAELQHHIQRNEIDCVYCCMPYVDNEQLRAIVDSAEPANYQVKLLIDFRGFLAKGTSMEYHDFLPVINVSSQMLLDFRINVLKRAFDVAFSTLALGFGSPLLLFVAAMTRATSKGPVLYAQERIGRGGKPFTIYKFRSMYINSESAGPLLSAGTGDNRITPWGRFMRQTRLDELPQFYNVLKGDMSVVGPRPERQFFIDQIVEVAPEYKDLFNVKPGITSIGQVKFGYAASIEEMVERLRYDLLYPKRRSFLYDMWIIVLTVRVMVQGRGK
ncbi:sugar transferase [Spirosoma rhododendri]|uniref:Sugar transferase n=1 Tax=Spirosoma rhododendri TaxID=2728024 RepID=A0A7L5DJT3_9BACT|nr:sugar transferase [Spirosoma rhododendri]QJD78375.1 sugar transferase [Spirosoma rhododendri]